MYNSWRLSGNASAKVDRKMRVALDARYIRTTETEVFPSGGVGRYTFHLVKQLVKLDPELELKLIVPSGNQRPIVGGSNASRVREVRFNAPAHSMRTQFRLTRGIDLEGVDRFLDVFSGTGTISFTEKTQPEYLFRTLLPQCVSIMARLP